MTRDHPCVLIMSSVSDSDGEGKTSAVALDAGKSKRKAKRYTLADLDALENISDHALIESVAENPTYRGIQYAAQGGLAPVKTNEIDWDESKLRDHVKWRSFPTIIEKAGKTPEVFYPYTVIRFAAGFGAPIPIPWSMTGDVAVAMCLNMGGWLDNVYNLGKAFLKLDYHTKLVEQPQAYK
ncbi:unnamed protein product [Heligmosomoides polygyrus]|uniref:Uroporphyrinogen_deCOase domain-containing protein n=1 Tax=Heligmosomoides polygyrus TaxID=6339 RepID=A0A183GDE7_HELPZ|nr:unnamed protein product [Heligmosomoides polygyrus]